MIMIYLNCIKTMNIDFGIFKRISIAYDFKAMNYIELWYLKGFHEDFITLLWFTKLRNLMTIMIMNYCSKVYYDLINVEFWS